MLAPAIDPSQEPVQEPVPVEDPPTPLQDSAKQLDTDLLEKTPTEPADEYVPPAVTKPKPEPKPKPQSEPATQVAEPQVDKSEDTAPQKMKKPKPSFRFTIGEGYHFINVQNPNGNEGGTLDYASEWPNMTQITLGGLFPLKKSHALYFNVVGRATHFKADDSRIQDITLLQPGVDLGYEATLIPGNLGLQFFAGFGGAFFDSNDIFPGAYLAGRDEAVAPLNWQSAAYLEVGAGLPLFEGAINLFGQYQHYFGFLAQVNEEFPSGGIPLKANGGVVGISFDIRKAVTLAIARARRDVLINEVNNSTPTPKLTRRQP